MSSEENKDSINLDQLDLSEIRLEPEKRSRNKEPSKSNLGRWIMLSLLVGCIGVIMWIPHTHFFASAGGSSTLSFTLSGIALVIAFLGGRWAWGWLEESAANWEPQKHSNRPEREITGLERWLTLAVSMILIGVVIGLPDSVGLGGFSGAIKGLCGLGAAVLGGRWLLLQAQRKVEGEELLRSQPRETPGWVKWVSLSILLIAGILAGFGEQIFGVGAHNSVLAAVGLGVGLFGAIWLTKRFDETEQKLKSGRSKAPMPPEDG